MKISDLYVCKRLVAEALSQMSIAKIEDSELLRIAKVLQRSIRPLVERELNGASHAEG